MRVSRRFLFVLAFDGLERKGIISHISIIKRTSRLRGFVTGVPRVPLKGRRLKETEMNIEKYSERVRGFIQSAQTYALAQNHQQFLPEHLLKVLVDDEESLYVCQWSSGKVYPYKFIPVA